MEKEYTTSAAFLMITSEVLPPISHKRDNTTVDPILMASNSNHNRRKSY